MTLVDLNKYEIKFLIYYLKWGKNLLEKKDSLFPLPEDIENAPKEFQSIIYKLEKALTKK